MGGRFDQSDIDRLLNDFSWVAVVPRNHAELLFNAALETMRAILRIDRR